MFDSCQIVKATIFLTFIRIFVSILFTVAEVALLGANTRNCQNGRDNFIVSLSS